MKTEILIIGGGPAGVEAALTASVYSTNVTLISNGTPGEWKSGYTNIFLKNIEVIKEHGSFSLEIFSNVYNDWVEQQNRLLLEAGVQVMTGNASFEDEYSVKVIHAEGKVTKIKSEKMIIANGSRPVFPESIRPDGKYIFSYNTLSLMDKIPSSLVIVGDSPIGYEMVNLFMQLGVKVTWLLPEHRNPLLDDDIMDYIHTYYKENGVRIISGPYVKDVVSSNGSVKVIREDHRSFEANAAFVTLGFRPNLDLLKIENTNLELNRYGSLDCNEYGQTANELIYVIGDALSPVSFTGVHAIGRGRVAALHALGQGTEPADMQTLPLAFNENPQIAAVGQFQTSRKDIHVKKVPYDTRNFQAFATNKKAGFLKVVWDWEGVIIGASCVGDQAKEIITFIAFMIKLKITISQVESFVSVHPAATELPVTALQRYIKGIYRYKLR